MDTDSEATEPPAGASSRLPPPEPETARKTLMCGEKPIRVVMIDGAPHLVANDVCRALNLKIGGTRTSAKYLGSIARDHRGYSPWPTATGPKRCAIISIEGAILLTMRRTRRIDPQVRKFLKAHVLPLATNQDRQVPTND